MTTLERDMFEFAKLYIKTFYEIDTDEMNVEELGALIHRLNHMMEAPVKIIN